ncbi:MAG: superoxide dismutase, partial [Gemmatimonadota bacterium]
TSACSDQLLEPEHDVTGPTAASTVAAAASLPSIIPLPDDFQPEGIASGRAGSFYVGSLADGRIYKGSFRTGEGSILVPGTPGTLAVGLDLDERSNLLWVANGPEGGARVYDGGTGALIEEFGFVGAFVNDVIVTRDAAWFTDSFAPTLYRVPLDANGQPAGGFQTFPLGGDFTFIPGAFNANGIEAIPGAETTLVVVNSANGRLYTVDSETGEATLIQGVSLPSGDGLLLEGRRTLYVVQNALNQIAEVRLSPDLAAGEVVQTLTSGLFRIPTTVAAFGPALYAVNARFDVAPPGTPSSGIEFEVVRVEK